MWTGTSALQNLDQSLQTLRNDAVRLDNQLQALTDRLTSDERHRLKLLEQIAEIRLYEIEKGALQANLNAADSEAASLLEQRNTAVGDLNNKVEHTNQQLAEAESERERLLSKVNEVSQSIADLEAQVQTGLKEDSAYLAQFERAQQAESITAEAERKVDLAQQDMAEKAAPYKQDKLFMYLWERGFGTTEYQAGPVSRFMDAWVAKLIGYADARVNYWNLTEIPQRLSEHADRVGDKADNELMALQQLEVDALQQAGIAPLEQELEQLRANLDAHDDDLEHMEHSLNEYLDQRARFLAGEDEYIQRCLSRLTQAMDHQDLETVNHYVRQTASPNDDRVVIELRNLDARISDSRGDLGEVRRLHDGKMNKLKELEDVRRNFKNSRFDDVRSGFGNEDLIANVLGQFLQGIVTGADLWRVLKRNQRYRDMGSMPDFGSDGLGDLNDLLGGDVFGGRSKKRHKRRKKRASTWHWPSPRGGGDGFRLPRGGSDDFTTGGGF